MVVVVVSFIHLNGNVVLISGGGGGAGIGETGLNGFMAQYTDK